MTYEEYWESFEKIQQSNDIALMFAVIGFFILLIGIANFLVTHKNHIGRVAIITFYIIVILVAIIWSVNSYRFSRLYDQWKSTNMSTLYSNIDTK